MWNIIAFSLIALLTLLGQFLRMKPIWDLQKLGPVPKNFLVREYLRLRSEGRPLLTYSELEDVVAEFKEHMREQGVPAYRLAEPDEWHVRAYAKSKAKVWKTLDNPPPG